MKAAWSSTRLGDAVQAVLTGPFGSILHKSDYAQDGVPLVNPANIVDEQIALDGIKLVGFQKAKGLKSYELQVGDIVIGRRGEIGRCAVVTNEQAGWLCGTGSFIVRPGKSFDPSFLAAMLRSPACVANLVKAAAGATMPNLSNGSLSDLSVVVPPLEEQRRIVAVLDKAFAGIATATTNAQKNLTNARALFHSYLHSILVKRGDGWVDRPIGEIAHTSLGKMLDKEKNKGELHPYLRNINVRWFEFELEDLLQMRFEESEEDRYSIRKGDVVICEGGYPGRAAIWQSEELIYFQKALHRVRFKNTQMARWFVYILHYA